MIRIEYELPLAGHDCDYKANTPLLLPFLKCTDQFLIKTKTFPRSETELNREGIQYVLRNVLKRYEKFENENFLLRPWFDYVKDRQLGLIRGWCRVDIGLIKGYRGVTWPLMMTNSLISSPIIFCWGHFRHLAPSHISATSQLFLTSLDARRFWQFLTQRFSEEVWKQGKGKMQSNWLWR